MSNACWWHICEWNVVLCRRWLAVMTHGEWWGGREEKGWYEDEDGWVDIGGGKRFEEKAVSHLVLAIIWRESNSGLGAPGGPVAPAALSASPRCCALGSPDTDSAVSRCGSGESRRDGKKHDSKLRWVPEYFHFKHLIASNKRFDHLPWHQSIIV